MAGGDAGDVIGDRRISVQKKIRISDENLKKIGINRKAKRSSAIKYEASSSATEEGETGWCVFFRRILIRDTRPIEPDLHR